MHPNEGVCCDDVPVEKKRKREKERGEKKKEKGQENKKKIEGKFELEMIPWG